MIRDQQRSSMGQKYRGWYRHGAVMQSLTALALFTGMAAAQSPVATDVRAEIFAGSEYENYLRWLQSEGTVERYPWSMRSFAPSELDRLVPQDSGHPWRARFAAESREMPRLELLRPSVEVVFNSAFPYGHNRGAVWAGKGLTTAARVGFAARHRGVSLTIAPVLFLAQNAPFETVAHGWPGVSDFADPRHPNFIDLPQRFGRGRYARVDPGQSTLRGEMFGLAAGVSTAHQYWGPATEHPLILGNNAPGFAHVFLSSARPLGTPIGGVHGRILWGRLEQSAFSPVAVADSARRFATGAVGMYTPRWIPGLELGATRFFHMPWTSKGLSSDHYLKLVESFLKAGMPGKEVLPNEVRPGEDFDPDNQLASVFFRLVLPESALEVYGEYAREDHSWDVRDFFLEPDHSSGYVLGLRKLWRRGEDRFLALGGELVDTRPSHLQEVRNEAPFYVHGWTRQGHTHRGQLLGSAAGYGGGASTLRADSYHPGGRWTVAWTRTLRRTSDLYRETGKVDVDGIDLQHSLGFESLVIRGRWDIRLGAAAVYNLNRDFDSDAVNLHATLGAQVGL